MNMANKVETETSAKTIIRTYNGDSEYQRSLRAAAEAVLDGSCQLNQVAWAVDALGEVLAAAAGEQPRRKTPIADSYDVTDAEAELERAWSRYQKAQG